MKIEWIQAFCDICKYNSFSKASDALFVSRNSLMRSIESMEAELGVILFERSSKGLQLTEAGMEVADHARELLRVYYDMLRCSGRKCDAREYRLGVPGTHSDSYAMMQCIKIFNEQNSPLSIRVIQCPRDEAESAILDGRQDYFFSTLLPKDKRLTTAVVSMQEFVFLVRKSQFPENTSAISNAKIADSDLIFTAFSERPQQILEERTGLSVENNIKFRSTDLSLIYKMVAEGEGIAMLTPIDAFSGAELHKDLTVLYPESKIEFHLRLMFKKKIADLDVTRKLTGCILRNYEKIYIK